MKDLTEEQKLFINKKVEEGLVDFSVIANLLYERTDLSPRSAEAKTVRNYMISWGLIDKKTTKQKKDESKESVSQDSILQTSHMEFIDQNIRTGITPKQITELLFSKDLQSIPNYNIFLTPHYKAVHKYIKERYSSFLPDGESGTNDKYSVPRSMNTLIKKIDKWVSVKMEESRLTVVQRKCLERLFSYLGSPRFIQNYDSYRSSSDKELFEAEFIRCVWDKPDLTNDELNLYINVCMDYVNVKQIDNKKNMINEMFNETEDKNDLTMRLTEMLKTISEEYHQCLQRIDKTIQKLNGDRSKRIEDKRQNNANLLSLVESFQREEDRRTMIRIAEMQRKTVMDEANRLESMSDFKARILGVSKEEVV